MLKGESSTKYMRPLSYILVKFVYTFVEGICVYVCLYVKHQITIVFVLFVVVPVYQSVLDWLEGGISVDHSFRITQLKTFIFYF